MNLIFKRESHPDGSFRLIVVGNSLPASNLAGMLVTRHAHTPLSDTSMAEPVVPEQLWNSIESEMRMSKQRDAKLQLRDEKLRRAAQKSERRARSKR